MTIPELATLFHESGYYGTTNQFQAWAVQLILKLNQLEQRIIELENKHEHQD